MSDSEPPLIFRRSGGGLDRKWLRDFTARLKRDVSGGRSFTCMLSGDDSLRGLNRRFLGHDTATDVLSFPSPEPGRGLGEMAISVDRARSQARRFGHSVEQEIGILMLHGLLHLMGMDHVRDHGHMRRAERRWRVHLGLPAGLIDRAPGAAR